MERRRERLDEALTRATSSVNAGRETTKETVSGTTMVKDKVVMVLNSSL